MNQLSLDYAPLPADLDRRIQGARRSPNLSPCAADLLDTLLQHPLGLRAGRSKACSISSLQSLWGRTGVRVWSERTIKGAAKALLEEFEVPIGSSRKAGAAGFYICLSDADAEETVRPYQHEIYSLFRRIKCLAPNSAFVRRLNGQLTLAEDSSGR